MKIFRILLLLCVVPSCCAQTWFHLGAGDGTVSAPVGTTLRYGSPASTYVCDGAGTAGTASPAAWSSPVVVKSSAAFALRYQIVGVNRRHGKNNYRRREIPIAGGACVWALERLIERAGELVGKAEPHLYMFPRRVVRNQYTGELPTSETGFRKMFEEVRDEAGVPWFCLNGWRHTAITRLAEAGVNMAIIQRRAGHSSPKMTEHYTHITEQAERLELQKAFAKKPSGSAGGNDLRRRFAGY